ncbi:petC, partial [Symbiodinium sp. CCMP2456]
MSEAFEPFQDAAVWVLKGASSDPERSTPEKVLSRFDQICLELHWLGRPMRGGDYETKARALEKLAEQFVLLHAHGNSLSEPRDRLSAALRNVGYGDILNVAGCQLPDEVGLVPNPMLDANNCQFVWLGGRVGRLVDQVGAARFNADVCCNFRVEASDTLKELQKKNEHLRVQLSKSPWPKLKCFSSDGQSYRLPLRAQSRDVPSLHSEDRQAYLSGFFDGDGCVSCQPNWSGCYLSIAQSFNQAEVLMLFYETFGGSITLLRDGMGLHRPSLRWMACGQSARNAAQLLVPHSITKRKQLLLAAQWPEAKSDRKDCKAELRALKEYDSAVAGPCSWEYCAGFFDAEGYIKQQHGGASLQLQIKQKHPRVLMCLREFLARSLGKDSTLAKSGGSAHVLLICGLTSCKQILQHFLAAGLLCKAEQAKLVLGLTTETAAQVDAELGRLTGNQKFGKRLDAAGRQRAKKIASTRKASRAEAHAKLAEEHELLNAVHENQQLLQYMSKVQSLHDNSWEGVRLRLSYPAKSCREGCKAELRALKEYDSAVAGPCCWEYFAGFFDAEGYIQQRSGGASLDLQIGQKYPRILKCLRDFVARELGIDVRLRKMKRDLHALEVNGLLKCKQFLQHLLNAGMLCKAKPAELAVGLLHRNAGQVSSQLAHLTGNQTFGKKLDAAGCARAKKIMSAQAAAARLKRQGQFAEAVAKLGEVEVLKAEHELLKAGCENRQLMEYMRKVQSLHRNSWEGPLAHG